MKNLRYALLLALVVSLASTQASEPTFSTNATADCVAKEYASSPGLSGHTVLGCVGRSAQACMMSEGGDTTIGMIACLERETKYWESRLETALDERLRASQQEDTSGTSMRGSGVSLAASLRDMQSAWTTYKDAACLYEYAQWLGGSGAGPATMACHMHETARQTLKLEGWWGQ